MKTDNCKHEKFTAQVDVFRVCDEEGGPVTRYTTDITVHCAECLCPFEFIGPGCGASPSEPMVDVERVTLRAPIKPVSNYN
jgi:hypothetical protein